MPFPIIFAAVVTGASVGFAVLRKLTRNKDNAPEEVHLDPKAKKPTKRGPKIG